MESNKSKRPGVQSPSVQSPGVQTMRPEPSFSGMPELVTDKNKIKNSEEA